jgi:hypothetical protein
MYQILRSLLALATPLTAQDRERAYLDAAVSRFDLERREREVERGLFRPPHPYA